MVVTIDRLSLSRVFAAELARLGVQHVFNLMGEDTAPLVTALAHEHRAAVFTTRHESAAVMAADSYAWATNDLAVCVLSHGPGFSNGLTALTTAARSHRKVLLIAGHDARNSGMRPEVKRSDQAALAAAAGAAFFVVRDVADAVATLHDAAESAASGRTAVLLVPADVLNAEVDIVPSSRHARRGTAPEGAPVPAPTPEDLARVAAMLRNARKPLIVAGRGALHAKGELVQLAERTGALLGTSLLGHGLFHANPLNVGIVGGWASDSVRPLLDEFDAVVVFGASLNSFTMAFGNLFRRATIMQVDIDRARLGANHPVAVAVVADSKEMADALLSVIEMKPNPELHRPEVLERIRQPLYMGDDESVDGKADPRVLASLLDQMLPDARTVVTDGGHFMGFPGMYMHVREPSRFRTTASFASIGLGIGAALGVAVARPEEQIVLFVGDGGLMMSLGDLETLARYQVPIVVVVMDDGALGAERHFLDLMGLSNEQSVFGDVDFAAAARALGIASATVRSADDLQAVASEIGRKRGSPFLLDCKIRGDLRARWLEEIA